MLVFVSARIGSAKADNAVMDWAVSGRSEEDSGDEDNAPS